MKIIVSGLYWLIAHTTDTDWEGGGVWWRWRVGGAGGLVVLEGWWRWRVGGAGGLVALEGWWRWRVGGAGGLVALEGWWRWRVGGAGGLVAQLVAQLVALGAAN